MARKPRDYAGEYARRIAKGTAEGKSRTAARGHISQTHERAQRGEATYRKKQGIKGPYLTPQQKLNVWADKTRPKHIDPQTWRGMLYASVENHGGKDEDRLNLARKLQHKWEMQEEYARLINSGKTGSEASDAIGGQDWYDDRDDYDPVEIYWYQDKG